MNVPNRWDLYSSLAVLYWWRLKDPCQARDYFLKASQFKDAPSYCLRMYVRRVEECESPRAAYEIYKQLWRNGHPEPNPDGINLKDAFRRELLRLEDALNIPAQQRLVPQPHA